MTIIKHETETVDQAPDAPATQQRLGFMAGEIEVPKDFDRMGEADVDAVFGISD